MNRRSVVAVGTLAVLVLLAGCSAAGSLDMGPATDERVAEAASRAVPETADEPVESERIVREAIDNGSATARSREPQVESGLPFRADGRYYNVSSTVIDRQPGTAYRLGIDYNGTASNEATVVYGNLSARDRRVLDQVLPPVPVTADPGPDYYFDGTYTDAEREQSVLLADDTDAVQYQGESYPVTVEDTESVTVPTRRYTATVVANSTDAYARHLRSEYLFTLSGLSDAERPVVREAINDTYYAEDDDDEAFGAVLERFQGHEAIERTEYRGVWLVRYDGEVYLAELSYEGYDTA
jgi:hypothetical protein